MTDMKKNGVITFAHIWTIFPPSICIYAPQDNQDRAFRLQTAHYGVDRNQQPVFGLSASYVDFDGQRFGTQKMNISIPTFEGTKRINSLVAFPIELHDNHELMKAKLIERGGRVESLSGTYFQSYNGVGWRIGMQGNKEKFTVKGRVVIDPFGWNRFEPDFAVYVNPLNAQVASPPPGAPPMYPPSHHARLARLSGLMRQQGYNDPGYLIDNPDVDDGGMPADGFFEDDENAKRPALTDEQKLICTPLVRGYAVKEKKWLNLFVNAMSVSFFPFTHSLFFTCQPRHYANSVCVTEHQLQRECFQQSQPAQEPKGPDSWLHVCQAVLPHPIRRCH